MGCLDGLLLILEFEDLGWMLGLFCVFPFGVG
jgi:hypothetical protein